MHGYAPDTNKLLVVNCKLPAEVRQLGPAMTYVTPRTVIRATAADCESNGGEYAISTNLDGTLKVWLPEAEGGNPEAQNLVGQVYEKKEDYIKAFNWYKKSADQNYSRAWVNLGHLYEHGLGVAQNDKKSRECYANGLGMKPESSSIELTDVKNLVENSQPPKNKPPTEFPAHRHSPFFTSQLPTNIDFGQYYAVIIGNAIYKDSSLEKLATPINDALSADKLLRERYGFKTKLLTNADRQTILLALDEMKQQISETDNLLIYFAGHGMLDEIDRKAYWLPVDAQAGNKANWIASENVTDFISILPARHIMVVADTCYSGEMAGLVVTKLADEQDEKQRDRWLEAMNSHKARTMLASGGIKPVLDEGSNGHSFFANAFLQALQSNQGLLEDYELFLLVYKRTHDDAAAHFGFDQSPRFSPLLHAGHEGSQFFFIPKH